MLRRSPALALVLILACSAFAEVKDLKSRADSSSGSDKAKYAAEYAEHAVHEADILLANGKDAEGTAMLQDVGTYGKMAADVSMQSRKREKNTEITLRKILKRLADIKNAQPFEQQAEVQKVIDQVQASHDSLLDFMFQKGH